MSAFQSTTQADAFQAITMHDIDGVQLTPGNLPSAGFEAHVSAYTGHVRVHHGFAWSSYRRPVYDEQFNPVQIERDRSVHPPRSVARRSRRGVPEPVIDFARWLPTALAADLLVETMYPGYCLGSGDDIELALDADLRLCVDISHLYIQQQQGVLGDATLRRLLDSERIEEIHVSTNDGRRDSHRPLSPHTPWLDWARERIAEVPVVIESYWHHCSTADQNRQLDLLRGGSMR